MTSRYSPLRYPGGKARLAPYIAELIRINNLEGCHYVEPFAGGAGVALKLLFSEHVRSIRINDIDPYVFAFWTVAVHDTDSLVSRIRDASLDLDFWRWAREVRRHPERASMRDMALSTLVLNRTNRSGILNGGVIGGLSQTGRWKLDCRFNKDEIIKRLLTIGLYRSRIKVSNDAAEILLSTLDKSPGDKFLYIDPPYFVKGAYLYDNHYERRNHESLATAIRSLKHNWLVSYDDNEDIRDMYSGFEQQAFTINYSARKHELGAEVMIFGSGLKRPANIYTSNKEAARYGRTMLAASKVLAERCQFHKNGSI